LGINFTTVTRAYSICEKKGLVYAIVGNGTFVSKNAKLPISISLDNRPINTIEMGFIASFERFNHIALGAITSVTRKKYAEQLLNYSDPTGMPHQKSAGLNWMRMFGINAELDNVVIASGAQNAMALAMFALFEPGDRIAVDTYTYSNFIGLARMFHIHLMPVQSDTEGMLPDKLESRCVLNDISGVFLMPSCCNPTAVMISDNRKRELAKIIRKHDLILIEDDAYAFLTAGIVEDYKQPMYQLIPDNAVYISSTSKPICSGLRVAFMVFGKRFRERILKAVFNVNVKTSAFDTEVIAELILSGKAHHIAGEKIRLSRETNKLFADCFGNFGIVGHPLSLHRWLPLQTTKSGEYIETVLKDSGVRAYHSDRFLCGSGERQHYLRISLSSANSIGELEDGLRILRAICDTKLSSKQEQAIFSAEKYT
jgi:DNA-binding transcriptional MocR family regulator